MVKSYFGLFMLMSDLEEGMFISFFVPSRERSLRIGTVHPMLCILSQGTWKKVRPGFPGHLSEWLGLGGRGLLRSHAVPGLLSPFNPKFSYRLTFLFRGPLLQQELYTELPFCTPLAYLSPCSVSIPRGMGATSHEEGQAGSSALGLLP